MKAHTRVLKLMLTMPAALLLGSSLPGQSIGHAPTVLLVSGGSRALGLGDAIVAGTGAEALFYNPAQIGTRGSSFSIARYGGAATLGTFATVGRVAGNSVAMGVRFLDFGAEAGGFPASAGSLLSRGPLDATSLDAMLAAANSWFGIRFGGAVHYVSEQQRNGRASGVLFDAGVSRQVAGVNLGFSVQNLGQELVLDGVAGPLPTRFSLGGMKEGMAVGTFFDLAVAAAVTREEGGRLVPGAGVELTWEPVAGWTATGRLGARRRDPAGLPGASMLTLGASVGLDALTLDYAFQPFHDVAGGAHRIGLRIR